MEISTLLLVLKVLLPSLGALAGFSIWYRNVQNMLSPDRSKLNIFLSSPLMGAIFIIGLGGIGYFVAEFQSQTVENVVILNQSEDK